MKTTLKAPIFAALASLVALPVTARAQLEPDRPDFVQQLSMALVRNAKQLCSVIFVVGRTPKEAMSIGDITRWESLNDWWKWHKIDVFVDTARKRVTLGRYPAPPRTAVYNETLGCTMLPAGEDRVLFHPVVTRPNLPPAASTPWPMGDAPDRKKAMGINVAKVNAVLDSAFANNNPEKGERGWVVLHDGVIVGERYGKGYDRNTRNLSFSAGKSVLATIVGVLVGEGKLRVEDKAPIAEWAAPDPRSAITVKNLLNMEGGLACNNYNQTHPLHFTPEDHHSIGYNEGVDAVQASISVPIRFTPGTVNRYLNCDVLAIVKIVRQIVEKDGVMDQLSFPQRGLFDKIGVRSFVVEPDPYGNFLFNGHDYVTTRDWARLGLLYQQRGMFNGKRVLPEGWDRFVSSPAAASNRYGAFFWLATPQLGIPRDAYYMSGAEGNTTLIMPSHGVVIAKNAWSPVKNFFQLARMVGDAVVKTSSDCANNGWRDYGFDGEEQCTSYVARRGTAPAGPLAAGNSR
jgi:CubicO group peptidase (beta-lactamase class C family)